MGIFSRVPATHAGNSLNEFVFGSTARRIAKQPTLGSLFFSQNGVTFTASQNADLTFKIYKTAFKNSFATAVFHNASLPKRKLDPDPIITTSGQAEVKVLHLNSGFQVGNVVKISGVDSTGVGGLVDSAIKKSELGLNPQIDGQLIRLPIPELNEERRIELKKLIKSMGEKCKISIRNIRRDANEELKKLLKSKEIGEDEEKSFEKNVQNITDKHIQIVDEKVSSKEKEIMTI